VNKSFESLKKNYFTRSGWADETAKLYCSASEVLDLDYADYLTIKDLVNFSGYNSPGLHALLLAMFSSLHQGSICIKFSLESLSSKFFEFAADWSDELATQIIRDVYDYSELVHIKNESPGLFDETDDYKPLILCRDGENCRIYFQKYYFFEQKLKQNLLRILKHYVSDKFETDSLQNVLSDILTVNPICISNRKLLLNSEQIIGILLPYYKNFTIVSGGPGTGKTSIVVNMLRLFVRLGIQPDRIRVAAPTGRASMRLTESIRRGLESVTKPDQYDRMLEEISGMTLHRLLRFSPGLNDFLCNKYNRIPADLVIVDEASMIDVVLMGKLLEATDENTRLVLLGDRNQLPSVDAGAVLSDLVPEEGGSFTNELVEVLKDIWPSGTFPEQDFAVSDKVLFSDRVVVLNECYRSEYRIRAAAESINRGDADSLDRIPVFNSGDDINQGIWRIEPENINQPEDVHRLLDWWFLTNYQNGNGGKDSYIDLVKMATELDFSASADCQVTGIFDDIFNYLDNFRILTPVKAGYSGIYGLNNYLNQKAAFSLGYYQTEKYFEGMPLIITRNDYKKNLYNGDTGVILKNRRGNLQALFRRGEKYIIIPVDMLPVHEPAFAITIHKSQGSEYDRVLIILDEKGTDRLLSREILYTGITRAKSLAIIYGKKILLRKTVKTSTGRESGLIF